MGFVIVQSQPFGFNYLGGKLMSLFVPVHEVREICNKKYGMNLCLFETTVCMVQLKVFHNMMV
jgi:hypothetical protein